jgi:hypothetical protein
MTDSDKLSEALTLQQEPLLEDSAVTKREPVEKKAATDPERIRDARQTRATSGGMGRAIAVQTRVRGPIRPTFGLRGQQHGAVEPAIAMSVELECVTCDVQVGGIGLSVTDAGA